MKIRIVQIGDRYRIEKKGFRSRIWLLASTKDTIEECQGLVEDIRKGKRFIEGEVLKEKILGDGDVIQEFEIK